MCLSSIESELRRESERERERERETATNMCESQSVVNTVCCFCYRHRRHFYLSTKQPKNKSFSRRSSFFESHAFVRSFETHQHQPVQLNSALVKGVQHMQQQHQQQPCTLLPTTTTFFFSAAAAVQVFNTAIDIWTKVVCSVRIKNCSS